MHIHPVAPLKTIPDSSLYPFSDQNGAKTLPFGTAHTYMAYIREFPPVTDYPSGGGRRADEAYKF